MARPIPEYTSDKFCVVLAGFNRDGMPFNTEDLKPKRYTDFFNRCLDEIGFNVTVTDSNCDDLRLYFMDCFPEYMEYVVNASGVVDINVFSCKLVYELMLSRAEYSKAREFQAFLHIVSVLHFEESNANILKRLLKGKPLMPKWQREPGTFFWNAVRELGYKYMANLYVLPDDKVKYYYSKENLYLICLIATVKGVSFAKAKGLLDAMETNEGVLIKGLNKRAENMLIPYIMSGGVSKLTGSYYTECLKATVQLGLKQGDLQVLFAEHVKNMAVDLQNKMLLRLEEDYKPKTAGDPLLIYHCTPNMLGVAIDKGVALEDVFPETEKVLKRLPSLNDYFLFLGEDF